jgi:hypothetical protein
VGDVRLPLVNISQSSLARLRKVKKEFGVSV